MCNFQSYQKINRIFLLFFASIFFITPSFAAEAGGKYWIFFRDKGPCLRKSQLAQATELLSDRSLKRRAKVSDRVVDYTDVPVFRPYIDELVRGGIRPLVISKWLNAISANVSQEQIDAVKRFPFVKRVQRVASWQRRILPAEEPAKFILDKGTRNHNFDYGNSLVQNDLINVPEVHDLGIHGEGVLIAVFDTGFQLEHEAFTYLNVVTQWDFINNDDDPSYDPEQDITSQIHHGTSILSIIGGYAPGELVGPAFGADFVLAKTEDSSSETPAEEDNWIAAIEWADGLGADVITSSVGYTDWYTPDDMDGNTAAITIAADLAVKKGIVVCNAAGNEGSIPWKTVIAPADGDSVIAVGAVGSTGQIINFSSRGPTADGRIKPDVVAQGGGVYTVLPSVNSKEPDRYKYVSGTSASCPQAAGVAALVLCAKPELIPIQVREALRQTADRAHQPDNNYGWGLLNAFAAVKFWGDPPSLPKTHRLLPPTPNPYRPSIHGRIAVIFDLAFNSEISLTIYNIVGQKVRTLWHGQRGAGAQQRLSWNGLNDNDQPVPSGIYLCRLKIGDDIETVKLTVLR